MSSISYKFFCSGLPYKGYISSREMRWGINLHFFIHINPLYNIEQSSSRYVCDTIYKWKGTFYHGMCCNTQKRWEDEFAALKNEGGDKQSVMLLSRTTGAMHCDVLFHASSPAMKLNRKHVLCAATIVCLVLNEFVIFQFICEKTLLSFHMGPHRQLFKKENF